MTTKSNGYRVNGQLHTNGTSVASGEASLAHASDDDFDNLTPTTVYDRSSAYLKEFDSARRAGVIRGDQASEDVVSEKYATIARESSQGLFDPAANLHDREYEQEYLRQRELRQEAADGLDVAEQYVAASEDALARMEKPGGARSYRSKLFVTASAVLAIGTAPTIRDVFLAGLAADDPLAAWISAILLAIPIAALLAGLILVEMPGAKARFNWFGLIAGVGAAFGLLLVRYSVVGELDSLSLGIFVFESAVMLGVEVAAFLAREAEIERTEKVAAYDKAVEALRAVRDQLERRQLAYERADRAVKAHIVFVENRRGGTLFNQAIQEALQASAAAGRSDARAVNYAKKIGKKDETNE